MYGLVSREALSKRQSRWVHDIETVVKNNPVQTALTTPKIVEQEKRSIITSMSNITKVSNDENSIQKDLNKMKALYDDMNQINTLFKGQLKSNSLQREEDQAKIKSTHDAMAQTNIYLNSIVKNTESQYNDILIRIGNLEKLIMNTVKENTVKENTVKENTVKENTVKENTVKENLVKEINEFIPFIDNKDYIGRDNSTKINGTHLDMAVELFGRFSKVGTPAIIYPFGSSTPNYKFEPQTFNMTFTNLFNASTGDLVGYLSKRSDDVYIIEIEEEVFLQTGKTTLSELELPILITCKHDLE